MAWYIYIPDTEIIRCSIYLFMGGGGVAGLTSGSAASSDSVVGVADWRGDGAGIIQPITNMIHV